MDGIILVNKEKGITSFGVVSKIRKIFNTKKVGHCGTLDPEATGVLPIMIGQATKVSKYLVEHDKEYIAVLKLGVKTDSADSEGNIIKKDNFNLDMNNKKEYLNKISTLVGKQKQVPKSYMNMQEMVLRLKELLVILKFMILKLKNLMLKIMRLLLE